MNAAVVALVLAAAVLHATWNGLLKAGRDRLRGIAVMSVAGSAVGLAAALVLPVPRASSWPAILLSGLLHVGYNLFLVRAYRHGDLGEVYPIARGASPLLVTVGGALLAGDRLGPPELGGVLLVSAGILSLARGWGDSRARGNLLAALGTGVFIAAYTVTDGIGGRLSGSPPAYAAWLFVLDGPPMVLAFGWRRGFGARLFEPGAETLKGLAGGGVSVLAYGLVIWAASVAPMGAVSALRETSVVFALLIGRVAFGETLRPRRVAGCVAVAAGALLLVSG